MRSVSPGSRFWLVTGAALAGLTVALGAFGAHGLEERIAESVQDPIKNVGYWETASRYQMYHSLGLIAIGLASAVFDARRSFHVAGGLFVLGIILFSGLLYALALTDLKILGAIVPLGGLSMIIGWAVFAFGLATLNSETCEP